MDERGVWEIIDTFIRMTESRCYSPGTVTTLLVGYTSIQNTEKAMAPHSSTLAWKIPWTEEPGRLQSV